jgi:hypothetical protein
MHPVDVHELVYNEMRDSCKSWSTFLFAPSLQCDAPEKQKVKFVPVERQHSGRPKVVNSGSSIIFTAKGQKTCNHRQREYYL